MLEYEQHESPDEAYEKLDSKFVKRTANPTWRGALPYLNQMAPAPTYANLSQAALDLAATWKGDGQQLDRPSSSESDMASLEMVNEADYIEEGGDESLKEAVDPLPMALPELGNKAGAKGSVVSVAALPAFYRDSPTPDQLIPAELTFENAEDLCKTEMTGMEWFNSTGLVRMQEMWETHAAEVDFSGKIFVESLEALHAQALHAMAKVKNFHLKAVLMILKRYTDDVRAMTLQTYRNFRQEDDEFSNGLYHGVKLHFEKGLQSALAGSEKRHREKLRNIQERHQTAINNMRSSSKVTLQQNTTNLTTSLVRRYEGEKSALRDELTKKLDEANQTITKLKKSEDMLKQEASILKQDFKQLKAEHRVLLGYKSKFEKEYIKHEKLRKETAEERERNIKYIEALRAQMEEALSKRDDIISRSRDTIFRLEAELLTYRAESPPKPPSRVSIRSGGASSRGTSPWGSNSGDPGRLRVGNNTSSTITATPPLLTTSKSYPTLHPGTADDSNGSDASRNMAKPSAAATIGNLQPILSGSTDEADPSPADTKPGPDQDNKLVVPISSPAVDMSRRNSSPATSFQIPADPQAVSSTPSSHAPSPVPQAEFEAPAYQDLSPLPASRLATPLMQELLGSTASEGKGKRGKARSARKKSKSPERKARSPQRSRDAR